MDLSVRFYNTNSSLRSPLEVEEERPGRSTMPLHVNEDSVEETTPESEEEVAVLSTTQPVTLTEPAAEKVDVSDFEAIFLRFQMPITNFIYHLIGNREQASDLAQDVFVKAYKALLGGTIVQPGALSAWLYRIAANTTTDTLRRRRLISWLPLSLFNEDRGIGAGVISESSSPLNDGFNSDEQNSDARPNSVSS